MEKRKRWLLTGILAIQILIFYNFCYGDIFITLMHGLKFWDCLFFDNIRNFYSYSSNAPLVAGMYSGTYTPLYDFMIYIIFAIWELPLWAAQHFFGVENVLDTMPGALWGKSVMVPFIVLLVVVMRKIWTLTGVEEKIQRKNMVLFLTSVLFTAYVCIIGQYDVIPLSVIMLGIFFYAKESGPFLLRHLPWRSR